MLLVNGIFATAYFKDADFIYVFDRKRVFTLKTDRQAPVLRFQMKLLLQLTALKQYYPQV